MGASTMYYEGGEAALPVMETPLHGASVIQEMLLQSWDGRIRVFPAAPKAWPEASFAGLRAEGAFLVDAARHGGRTAWIRVRSLKGEPCFLQTDMTDPRPAAGQRIDAIKPLGGGLYRLDLAAGEEIVLAAPDVAGPFHATAPALSPARPAFGLIQ
jgi:alpha-L-fucosidase 2